VGYCCGCSVTLFICMASAGPVCYYNINILSYLIISLNVKGRQALMIRPEKQEDTGAVGSVIEQAFGQKAEVELVNQLRRRGKAVVSLVAEVDGRVVGHI